MPTYAYCILTAPSKCRPQWERALAESLHAATLTSASQAESVFRAHLGRAANIAKFPGEASMGRALAILLICAAPYADAHRHPSDCLDLASILLEGSATPLELLRRIEDELVPWSDEHPRAADAREGRERTRRTVVRSWTVGERGKGSGIYEVTDDRGEVLGPFGSYEDAFKYLEVLAETEKRP